MDQKWLVIELREQSKSVLSIWIIQLAELFYPASIYTDLVRDKDVGIIQQSCGAKLDII